jgi:virginiamycin A acetyltransferase
VLNPANGPAIQTVTGAGDGESTQRGIPSNTRTSRFRETIKAAARGAALVFILPFLVSFRLRALFVGSDRALLASSQTLAFIPGLTGQYVRRAFFGLTLEECHKTAVIEFGVLFSKVGARVGEKAYIGPYSHIGLAHIERNVLIAPAVHIPSGTAIHGTALTSIPISEQPGNARIITVGEGSWIGSGAVIMADVGRHTIIGAGAVVTKPIPDFVLACGSPATVIRNRRDPDPSQR